MFILTKDETALPTGFALRTRAPHHPGWHDRGSRAVRESEVAHLANLSGLGERDLGFIAARTG
jgi:hypothetical protein